MANAETMMYWDDQEKLQDGYEAAVASAMEELFLAEAQIYVGTLEQAGQASMTVPEISADVVEAYIKSTALLALISLLVSQNAHHTAQGAPVLDMPDIDALAQEAIADASRDIVDILATSQDLAKTSDIVSTTNRAVTAATRRAEHAAKKASDKLARIRLLSGTKTWMSRRDNKVRETHRLLDGVTVDIDAPFFTATGARLMFPGDTTAPIKEWINCRCWADYAYVDETS